MAEPTHYDTLGVSKNASQDDIKKAYRKLVRQYHPDVSTDPEAGKKTSAINQAYNILKDPEKRAEYDAMLDNPFAGQAYGGAQSFTERDFHYNPYDFGQDDFRFEDLFSTFNHAREQRRQHARAVIPGEDQHAEITIDISAAYQGAERQLVLDMPTLTPAGDMHHERKTLQVKIPEGIREGQQIRLRGQGLPGFNGGENGDLYLKVRFREQPGLYVKNGKDVYQRIDILPWQAVLGATQAVDTPAGKLEISIPANSKNAQNLRLKGKGIPGKEAGDLYLILNIVLPRADSEDDKAVWQQLADHYARKGNRT